MPVVVKQFNEGVSQAEVEHEANIISSFNEAKPFMLVYCNSNSFFGRNDSTDFYDFFDSFCKNSLLNISRYLEQS